MPVPMLSNLYAVFVTSATYKTVGQGRYMTFNFPAEFVSDKTNTRD